MTRRSDFTTEEWALLRETVTQAAAVMMAAAPGGLLGEMAAGFSAVIDAAEAFPDDELIQDLLSRGPEAEARREPQRPPFEQARPALLASCRVAVDLLARKATPEELSDYRRLVLYVAEKVASAGKEGTFLGIIGGRRVSEAEMALVEAIAGALGVTR